MDVDWRKGPQYKRSTHPAGDNKVKNKKRLIRRKLLGKEKETKMSSINKQIRDRGMEDLHVTTPRQGGGWRHTELTHSFNSTMAANCTDTTY
jgi:hypothetical protein